MIQMKHKKNPFSFVLIAIAAGAMLLPVSPMSAASNPDLLEKMDALQDHYRDLGRGLRDASDESRAELLGAAQQMQVLTVEAKAMEPAVPEGTADAEKEEIVTKYRTMMVTTLETLLQIEKALLAREYEKAQELFDVLKANKDEGHQEFRIDD